MIIEGPYGVFTSHTRRRKKVALIAAGIGVTAIRALLEDLPLGTEPVVLYRASSEEQLVLADELAELVRQRKGRLHELVGSRTVIAVDRLVSLIPDLKRRDVYVAGPDDLVRRVVAVLRSAGVAEQAIHFEEYSLP